MMRMVFVFFFFSSRRRHTRLQGDWSSDVCSSDLETGPAIGGVTSGPRSQSSFRQRAGVPLRASEYTTVSRPFRTSTGWEGSCSAYPRFVDAFVILIARFQSVLLA